MPTHSHGRHEYGQNFLTDQNTIVTIIELAADGDDPILEIGPGSGALTRPLARLGRPVTAVEIDARLVSALRRDRGLSGVCLIHDDFLKHRLPSGPHTIVGNLPFHQTTAILRRLLHAPHWTRAILLLQWEVARRRAGIGGATMMTAQWSPWFDFRLIKRVPARAFTPRPGVDGGLLVLTRHTLPGAETMSRNGFQSLVHRVFTGRGCGLAQILVNQTTLARGELTGFLRRHGLSPSALPKDLTTEAWLDLYRSTGSSPPRRR